MSLLPLVALANMANMANQGGAVLLPMRSNSAPSMWCRKPRSLEERKAIKASDRRNKNKSTKRKMTKKSKKRNRR